MKQIARKACFSIWTMENKIFPGWDFNEEWNNWACPYFEKQQADEIATICEAVYDLTTDTYLFIDDLRVEGINIDTTEGVKKVYPIGAYCWCWEETIGI